MPHRERLVRFTAIAPESSPVEFVSDILGWDHPTAMVFSESKWQIDLPLPPDARLEYQFVMGGKWFLDPGARSKCENGFGGQNSVYTGPDYRFSPLHHEPVVQLRRMSVPMLGPNGKQPITIIRPVGRHQDLPIILFADGTEYLKKVRPHVILQNMYEQGRAPAAVTVFIPPVDRMREYLHESRPYEEFITQQVLPEVRRRTPASASADRVFVTGASLGGLISMRLAQNHPDLIAGGVHSQSGAFWASPGVLSLAALRKLPKGLQLVLDWGNFEGVLTASNNRINDALHRLERPHHVLTSPEGHNWTAWLGRYESGVGKLLSGLAKTPR